MSPRQQQQVSLLLLSLVQLTMVARECAALEECWEAAVARSSEGGDRICQQSRAMEKPKAAVTMRLAAVLPLLPRCVR